MTGTIENASDPTSSQSAVVKLNVPNAGWKKGS